MPVSVPVSEAATATANSGSEQRQRQGGEIQHLGAVTLLLQGLRLPLVHLGPDGDYRVRLRQIPPEPGWSRV